MISNRKGLSDVVTTVLIILLVVIAIGAIWAFVQPTLKSAGTQTVKVSTCLENLVEPVSCTLAGSTSSTWFANVTVKRTMAGAATLGNTSITFVSGGLTLATIVPSSLSTQGTTATAYNVFAGLAGAKPTVSARTSSMYTATDGSPVNCNAPTVVTCA